MKKGLLTVIALATAVGSAAGTSATNSAPTAPRSLVRVAGPGYEMMADCAPFELKGAFASDRIAELARAGATCVAAPDTASAAAVLDAAESAGLMAAVVLDLEPAGGLAYSNVSAVASAVEALRAPVRQFKDHPRLLLWILRSRVSGAEGGNASAYKALNAAARLIRDEDPAHVVAADIGVADEGPSRVRLAAEYGAEIDALGLSLAGSPTNLARVVALGGWHKPYVLFARPAPAPAAVERAPWGAPIEPLSAERSAWCLAWLTNTAALSRGRCIGTLLHGWDPGLLVTPTWYSLHHDDGSQADAVDAVTLAWTGSYPTNRAPAIAAVTSAIRARIVSPGATETASVVASDPESDPLAYTWVLRKEIRDSGPDASLPAEYEDIPNAIEKNGSAAVSLTIPHEPGPYRLFVYVRDGRGRAASANIPFLVEAVRAPASARALPAPAAPAAAEDPQAVVGTPVQVTIQKTGVGGGWQLQADGKPFFVKGAGGKRHLEELKAADANAIRTWSTDFAGPVLDDAHRHGLMVCLGLWMKQERHGFDYSSRDAVQAQLDKLRAAVRRYRNHPALLMWCCGIEVEWGAGTNVAVYQAINEVARMVHEEDTNHPTTTAFADLGYNSVKAALAAQYCPELDIFGVNSYGGLPTMADRLRGMGWTRPYMIMEFGPRGQWESPRTDWGAEIEQMPLEKADFYLQSYLKSISSQENWCLGSFVFSWDYKMECTPTWYSMHLPDGCRLNPADTMWRAWSGREPTNGCPRVRWLETDLSRARVGPGQPFDLNADVIDPENDTLQYKWELMAEKKTPQKDGTIATTLSPVGGRITGDTARKARLLTPTAAGAYRVFLYVRDGMGNASSGNTPFYVDPQATAAGPKGRTSAK